MPFFIHYTQGFSREQRIKTIWISSFSAFAVIATSALAGLLWQQWGAAFSFAAGAAFSLLALAALLLLSRAMRPALA